jgi:nucleoside-diphosphate-sugar epimerase
MVTGGTGFVGSHTVAELIKNGHQVRLLVRSKEKIEPALSPLGVQGVDAVVGDVLDKKSIEQAAEGCDATIHCGSVYSLDSRASGIIKRTNVTGTDNVLEVASRLGHDPIIHISSIVALLGKKACVITPDSAPLKPPGVYFRSKADSDKVAREFQKNGAPVVITYPGSVWGPYDPHCGESCQMAQNILKGYWKMLVKGKIPISDVRDIARLHVALMEKGQGPRRYIAPVHNVTLKDMLSTVSDVTGRNLDAILFPAWTMLWPMRALDFLQKFLSFRFPINFQAVYCAYLEHTFDDAATRSDFSIEPRHLAETILDQISWMVKEGHIDSSLVGTLKAD